MKLYKKTLDEGTKYECVIWKNEYNQFHREDGPAVIYIDGVERWFLYGKEYYEKEKYKRALFETNLKKLNEDN